MTRDEERRRRKLILKGAHVVIHSNSKYPIAVDDQQAEKPYITTDSILYNVAGRVTLVKPAFRFDGSSIPLIVWIVRALVYILLCRWLYRKWSTQAVASLFRPLNSNYRNLKAGCKHDWDYAHQEVPKSVADAEFEAVLIAQGEWWVAAKLMRVAVEVCGHSAWNEHTARLERAARVLAAGRKLNP